MSFGFRKRKKLLPGVSLNLSKRGAGLSVGRRGASASRGATGQKRVSLGWKGLFWRKRV
ncbi:MAG: DUF4236 domain-containing protein [Gaiellaceae bacterium]